MHVTAPILPGLTLSLQVTQLVTAQTAAPTPYEDPESGIIFDTWASSSGSITFGVSLPEDALENDADEFIGYLVSSSFETSPTRKTLLTGDPKAMLRLRLVWTVFQRRYDQQPPAHGLPVRRRDSDQLCLGYWLRNASSI